MENLRKLIKEGTQSVPACEACHSRGSGGMPPRKILKFGCLKPDSGAILTHMCMHLALLTQY